MKLTARIGILVLGFVVACSLWGCVVDDYVPVPPPIPPTPPVPPTPPTPPAPVETWPRATFESVEVGDPVESLSGLPPAPTTVRVETGREIRSWPLDEERPSGGHVRWEIHIAEGVVAASFPW